METTVIRENLMTQEGYTPYCGWTSSFPEDFIKRYKEKWNK